MRYYNWSQIIPDKTDQELKDIKTGYIKLEKYQCLVTKVGRMMKKTRNEWLSRNRAH